MVAHDNEDTFVPTHEITICGGAWGNGERVIQVRDCDGVLYTRLEWDAGDTADWTRDADGTVLFQGRIPNCHEYSVRRIR